MLPLSFNDVIILLGALLVFVLFVRTLFRLLFSGGEK